MLVLSSMAPYAGCVNAVAQELNVKVSSKILSKKQEIHGAVERDALSFSMATYLTRVLNS